ncbi:MAG: hypothetical protein ACE15F_15510 [bacterium]
MNKICRQYQESYGEPLLPESTREHASVCPACQEFTRRQQALEAKLPAWTPPDFSPDFTLAVMSRLAEEKQHPEGLGARLRHWIHIRIPVPLPAGALASLVLLISLGLNMFFWSREQAGPRDTPAVAQIPEAFPTPVVMQTSFPASWPRRDFFSTGAFLLIPLGDVHFPMDSGEALSIPGNGNARPSQAY